MKKDIDLTLKESIRQTVLQGLGTEIDIEDINDDTDLIDDLGFHSLIIIRFVVVLEEVFGIEIDEDDLYNGSLTKYSKIRDYIEKNISK